MKVWNKLQESCNYNRYGQKKTYHNKPLHVRRTHRPSAVKYIVIAGQEVK